MSIRKGYPTLFNMSICHTIRQLIYKNSKHLVMQDQSSGYNWVSVLSFLQKEYSKNSLREKEWLFQKHVLQQKIYRLEGQLQGRQTLQGDLLKRIRLLEMALLREKKFTGIDNGGKDRQVLKGFLKDYPAVENKLKNQGHQQFLQKMMADLGINQVIQDPLPKKDSIYFLQEKGKLLIKPETLLTLNLQEENIIAAHLDSVQKMYKNPHNTFLATISEDCLIKLWPYPAMKHTPDIQPSFTLRQHTGPLFSLTGGVSPFNPQETLIFTAGSEGCIKCWTIPDPYDISKSYLSGGWVNSMDQKFEDHTIWRLEYNGQNQKLLSVSSDGFVRMFGMKEETEEKADGGDRVAIVGQEKGMFREKQFNQTCVEWISERTFVTGCQNAPRVTLWDITGKICQKYIYEIQKSKEPYYSQVNCTKYHHQHKTIISGCQDGYLRLFDFDTGKIIKKLKTHSGSGVSCLQKRQEWEVVCGCHDGGLAVWDLRKFAVIFVKKQAHLVKYDEGVKDLLVVDGQGGGDLFSSGADGIVKVYHQK